MPTPDEVLTLESPCHSQEDTLFLDSFLLVKGERAFVLSREGDFFPLACSFLDLGKLLLSSTLALAVGERRGTLAAVGVPVGVFWRWESLGFEEDESFLDLGDGVESLSLAAFFGGVSEDGSTLCVAGSPCFCADGLVGFVVVAAVAGGESLGAWDGFSLAFKVLREFLAEPSAETGAEAEMVALGDRGFGEASRGEVLRMGRLLSSADDTFTTSGGNGLLSSAETLVLTTLAEVVV